jgi:hypothetical protein
MKQYKFLFIALSICFFSRCKNNSAEEKNTFDPNAKGYQINQNKIEQGDVLVEASLKDNLEKGELMLALNIKNNSGNSISVDYTSCSLTIDAERVVVPMPKGTFKNELADGTEEHYEIDYYPINTLDFYYRTDYRGDMKKYYGLKLDFITDKHGNQLLDKSFEFQLSDSAYHDYLNTYAREKYMQISEFDVEETFATEQKAYLKKILPDQKPSDSNQAGAQEFISAMNPVLTINKRLINFSSYKYKDTLSVSMRLLNQDANVLKVLIDQCKVKASGNSYSPLSHFSDSFESGHFPDNTYLFKSGTRLHLLLKYYIPEKLDKWEFSMDWLLVNARSGAGADRWVKLLYSDVKFKDSPVNKD